MGPWLGKILGRRGVSRCEIAGLGATHSKSNRALSGTDIWTAVGLEPQTAKIHIVALR